MVHSTNADSLDAEAYELEARAATLHAAAARQRAIANGTADTWLPLPQVAEMLSVTVRFLRDAGARGDLQIEGPRGARVVRRAELDRWLASHAPSPKAASTADEREEARAAVASAAARYGHRPRGERTR